ncbi:MULTISPECIES: hypothetical protein [Marinovum]|uniref:capsular polysaccharide export protein, LipB/KpsS family n=1 Tax=Marinovum TaxID=367771 RepID=UPI00237A6E7E|nr:hypothetical protein [Marinovum sp. PR37]MDD9746387.1 hypothetical protein [Marinovum sp. PR37]
MKVYLDRPAGLWTREDDGLEEARFAFDQLCKALLRADIAFEVFERRPGMDAVISAWLQDGIYYTYHSEQPAPGSYCFKRGGLPFLWHMDPCGYSGWAEIAVSAAAQERAAGFDLDRARAVVAQYRARMQGENLSLLPQPERAADEAALAGLSGFVFYPLQVNEDMVLKLAEIPQYEALRTAARLAGERHHPLVIKRHPLCRSQLISDLLEEICDLPHVHVSEASVNTLLEHCGTVLVTNSSVGLHGLIWGRPVVSMGGSEYAHMTREIRSAEEIARAFDPAPAAMSARQLRQLGHLLAEDLVDIRDCGQIAARVQRHLGEAAEAAPAAPPATGAERLPQADDDTRRLLSNLHLLDRHARAELDFVLARYGEMDEASRAPLRDVLAGLARDKTHLNRILQRTDPILALKCLRFFQSRNETARMWQVIAAQARQPEAPVTQLFLYARWLFENGFAETAAPLLRQLLQRTDISEAQERFVRAALARLARQG